MSAKSATDTAPVTTAATSMVESTADAKETAAWESIGIRGYVYAMNGKQRVPVRCDGRLTNSARATAIDVYVAAVTQGFPLYPKIHERILLLMMSRGEGHQQPMCPDRTLSQNMFDEECAMHLYIAAASTKKVALPYVVVVR